MPSQDIDPIETQEWLDAFKSVARIGLIGKSKWGQGKVSGLQHRILVRSQVWYLRKSRFGGNPPWIPAVKSESGVVQSSLKRRTWLLSAHGVTGFAQVSSIYSQNYHPVTDAWESVPIASHLSFCTKGIHAWSCRIHFMLQNSQHSDSATPPYGFAQNDSILKWQRF